VLEGDCFPMSGTSETMVAVEVARRFHKAV